MVTRKLWLVSFAVTALCLLHDANGVDRNNFKTCEQSSFCRRLRLSEPETSKFAVLPETLQTYKQYILVDLQHSETKHLYVLKLGAVKGGIFHFQIDEKSPLSERYRVVDALAKEPEYVGVKVETGSGASIVVAADGGTNKAVVQLAPFKIDFHHGEKVVVSANSMGMMRFEHLRRKEVAQAAPVENEQEAPENEVQEVKEDPGAWEENFKSHHDSKPNGPEGLAMDFTFPQGKVLYGIPEHADSFILKHTAGGKSDPYRLYNLDVFEYELDNGMALYGAVPVIYGTGPSTTAGVYWQNAAETWVDIFSPDQEKNVMSSIVNFVSRSNSEESVAANFISESGIADVFVLVGPTPLDAFRQYTDLTGKAPLPQMYAIAYHQCRWNYNDEQDVTTVSAKFDEHDIPMDTMWLDIEYTDGKKYFTWDHHKFPHPLEMIRNLTERGRHLTIIIDPHIKRDGGYFFHNDCTDRGYYVKNKDGNDYEGWCWPGSASYADFFNPEVRKYYADQYLLENFKESTAEVGIWNDMNEPSVFNGPEVTMLKDNLHHGGWEHRDVHNLYGHMHIMATYEGLIRRGEGTLRPFILTRSHFAGSQRFAAVWTGDNMAEWGHLQASIKMCLSLSVSGISFCGADVGGFFGNPDSELFYRWYQTGAFQPFFRSHAHIDTKRREPWLFPEDVKLIIRDAVRKRYRLLPLWYTMFYEHERSGLPIMRPMLAHYPTDAKCYGLDSQYMLVDKLLVAPVLKAGQNKVDVYFPTKENGEGDLWYDLDNYRKYSSAGYESIAVDNYKVPVFQRGGTIVPRKDRIRRAATLMKDDPYTLVVAVDKNALAKGTLYIDDETSFEYRSGKYLYLEFEFKDNVLSSKDSRLRTNVYLEQMMRLKTNTTMDSRHAQQVDTAYYLVKQPEGMRIQRKVRPLFHTYIRHLIFEELNKSNVDKMIKLLRRLDWEDRDIHDYAVKCLSKAYSIRYHLIRSLADLVSGLSSYQEKAVVKVIDAVFEDIRAGLEIHDTKLAQRRIAMAKYLGELYNYRLVESKNVLNTLYSIISLGVSSSHDTPSEVDPPGSLFRLKLVCVLLDTCGQYFTSATSRKGLDYFLIFFQNYYWFKKSDPIFTSDTNKDLFPILVDHMYKECFKNLRPKLKLLTSYDASKEAIENIAKKVYPQLFSPRDDDERSLKTIQENDTDKDDTVTEDCTSEAFGDSEDDDENPRIQRGEDDDGMDDDMVDDEDDDEGDLNQDLDPLLKPMPVEKTVEDLEFEKEFERMATDSFLERLKEPVKLNIKDIPVPITMRSSGAKKTYEQLQENKEKSDSVPFVLMVRGKGKQQQYKSFEAPSDSQLAIYVKDQEQKMKEENDSVKRLTLNITERLEEEDYQESLLQSQRTPASTKIRIQKPPKFKHPKGVPDVDAIFH